MHTARVVTAALIVSTASLACGGTPKQATVAPEPAEAPVAPAPTAVSAAPEAPAPRKARPLEIHNACSDVVTVAFGEEPSASGVGKRTIAADASIDGARDDAGNATVWLLDDKGAPLVKVNVTRGMKRVEVGKSCRSLDAR